VNLEIDRPLNVLISHMVNNDNGYIQMIFRQGVNVRIAERTMEMRVGLI